jgi:branched-subunit amino acid aminotransferase/4-amino-4-deoxychorismate lyase
LNLLPNVLAKHYAEQRGCFDALLVDRRGDITECAGSAFAAISGNDILTRPLGSSILPSITRLIITQIAQEAGFRVVEKIICPFDLQRMEEMFVAVTTKDIVGVVELEGKRIGDGKVGSKTKKLQAAFMELIKKNIHR